MLTAPMTVPFRNYPSFWQLDRMRDYSFQYCFLRKLLSAQLNKVIHKIRLPQNRCWWILPNFLFGLHVMGLRYLHQTTRIIFFEEYYPKLRLTLKTCTTEEKIPAISSYLDIISFEMFFSCLLSSVMKLTLWTSSSAWIRTRTFHVNSVTYFQLYHRGI